MSLNHTTDRSSEAGDFARMKTSVLGSIDATERRRTKKHRLTALGAAGVIVLGTTAGAFAVAAAPQGQINYTADCYSAADLGAQHGTSLYLPGDEDATNPTPLAQRVSLATEMCATTWKIGTFESGTVPQGTTVTVPSLVACQLPDQRLAIFPSTKSADALCAELNLTTPHD